VSRIVEHYGFPVLVALSHQEAVQFAANTHLSGIFVISDWVIPSADGVDLGVATLVKHRIPTITLVRKSSDFRWFEAAYERPQHEYFTIPFSVEEVISFMRGTGMLTEVELKEKAPPEMAELLKDLRDKGDTA
jgi:DNA-binding NtrC family response regulator